MTLRLTTGYPSLDILLGGGVRPEDLIVLGGESGVGASALALGLAVRAAESGAAVAVLSTEMSPTRLAERALALSARATLAELAGSDLADERRAAIAEVALRLRGMALTFQTQPPGGWDLDDPELPDAADLLIVDALEGLAWGRHGRTEAQAAWVLAWKRLAIARGLPVVLVRHTAGAGAPRGARPSLHSLGDAGVEEHADVVLGLHRDDLHRPDPVVAGSAELLLLKDRFGTTGSVDLWFEPQWSRFEDLAEA